MAKFDRYEPILQDHTAMNVLDECDRKYFYRIVLGRSPRQSKFQIVLDFGNAYHKFREVLELTGDLQKAMSEGLKVKLNPPAPGSKFEFLNTERLMRSFAVAYEYWETEKKLGKIKVIHVEQPFNVALPDGTFVSGRMDQLVEWGGQLWNRDFKTTSKDEKAFQAGTDPNDQAIRYIYGGGKLHGRPLGGTIFEVLQNTKTVGPKIFPILSTRTPKQLEEWEKERIHINRQLNLNREHDVWPMRMHNCAWCDFAWVCRQPNEQAQMAKLQSDYVLQPWDHTSVEQKEAQS